ncbi:hypothetical protein GDO78_016904 [Eleutherodactylus coqui]|uniref:Uncharacterized protein n=1 Tax=Eleutherodactylus coqui TaxID=57060 RepID=A0A8J6C864_ELECQ|nr:hypothetical protein GDO78_016904 [Eleutherodactylus coqui]
MWLWPPCPRVILELDTTVLLAAGNCRGAIGELPSGNAQPGPEQIWVAKILAIPCAVLLLYGRYRRSQQVRYAVGSCGPVHVIAGVIGALSATREPPDSLSVIWKGSQRPQFR